MDWGHDGAVFNGQRCETFLFAFLVYCLAHLEGLRGYDDCVDVLLGDCGSVGVGYFNEFEFDVGFDVSHELSDLVDSHQGGLDDIVVELLLQHLFARNSDDNLFLCRQDRM